jgi:hypothetical protein
VLRGLSGQGMSKYSSQVSNKLESPEHLSVYSEGERVLETSVAYQPRNKHCLHHKSKTYEVVS